MKRMKGAVDQCGPVRFEIRIKGCLDQKWAEWFEGLTITPEDNGDTLLSGPVVDQAALYGLLKKVRNLGAPLLSVNRVESAGAEATDDKQGFRSKKGAHQ